MPKLYAFPQAGLGNRLFILASMMGYADKTGREFEIMGYDFNRHKKYPWLMERFGLSEEKLMGTEQAEAICREKNIQIVWDDRHTDFYCVNFNLDPTRDACMFGFFINQNYFKEIAPKIRELFKEPSHVTEYLDRYFEHPQLNPKQMVAIHVRLGDYKHSANHQIPLYNYYDKSIQMAKERFGSEVGFVIVCEEERETRMFYPNLFRNENIHIFLSSKEYPEIDLYAMTRFAGVICANSTFSWWGAWLNESPDKFITIPSRWLHDRTDIPLLDGAQIVSI